MLYLVRCKKCGIHKRFYRFYNEQKKICFVCEMGNTDNKTKEKIKWTLLKQARDIIWKVRRCLACDVEFETRDNIYKCPSCTEEHSKLLDWNSR